MDDAAAADDGGRPVRVLELAPNSNWDGTLFKLKTGAQIAS